MTNKSKITSLGILRGVAVLSVCFCHFATPASKGTVLPAFFSVIEAYGRYGVHIFFVISGFIIPYSLEQSKYALDDYFRFLYKRVIRLHPPYLIALAFTLIVAGISYKLRHLNNPETPYTIFQSLFYLHAPLDNPVFWTLRIEAEFYIFIGLYFAFLKRFPLFSILFIIPLLAASQTSLVNAVELLKYIGFFLTGTIGYIVYTGKHKASVLLLFGLILFLFACESLPASIAATLTISAILYFRRPVHSFLEFPGEISYSLYLIHFPIGIKFFNLAQRKLGPDYNWLLFLLSTMLCILMAWLFWKYIEKPSAKLSSKIKYGVKKERELPVAA
jgi:peptidoglycan/LPS O-acetylase OafA/YrhL